MFTPFALEQQLAATWTASRLDTVNALGGGRVQRAARRRRRFRLVRPER
jgi:hypothetical protein